MIFIINFICCVFQENVTSEISQNIKEAKPAINTNITKIVFDRCCDDGKLFDVITKRCILFTDDSNSANTSRQKEISLGALITKLLVIYA